MTTLFANSADPDQTPQNAASDQGLHCLPVILLVVCERSYVTHTNTKQMCSTCVQLYAYVTVTFVYECHMSNLTVCKHYEIFTSYKLQSKIDTVGLCRQDVATGQALHWSPLISPHFTLNGVKPGQMLYSRLSLSRPRLSRTIAYLEVKIWSLF